MKINLAIENQPRVKFRLHIAIGTLVLIAFIISIARAVDKGSPSGRAKTWGIAVCIKSAVFLIYQVLTAHHHRFKRWASSKANVILNIIDTVFWFALFILSIMGASSGCRGSGCALGGVLAVIAIILCALAGFLSFICIRDRRYFKANGVLPGTPKGQSYKAGV